MEELKLDLCPNIIQMNRLEKIILKVFPLETTIHNLCFDIKSDEVVQILGSTQFQLEKLETDQEPQTIILHLKARTPGDAIFLVRHIRGRVGGKVISFKDICLHLSISEGDILVFAPSFIPQISQIWQNQSSSFRFGLQNQENLSFKNLEVRFVTDIASNLDFGALPAIEILNPGEYREFAVSVLAKQSGIH